MPAFPISDIGEPRSTDFKPAILKFEAKLRCPRFKYDTAIPSDLEVRRQNAPCAVAGFFGRAPRRRVRCRFWRGSRRESCRWCTSLRKKRTRVVGFVEVGLRSAADGCDWARAVGYVEGWYVAESHRRRGVGAQLIAAAENWAREQGCTEMASDTQIDNAQSLQAHLRLGYEIAERSILFRKRLR